MATQDFLEQISNRKGEAAVLTCEEEAEDPLGRANAITVSKVVVDGSTATAEAAFGGLLGAGGLQRETVAIALVDEDGHWKLDKLTGARHGKLDQAKIAEDLSGSTPPEKSCFDRRFAQASQVDIEQNDLSEPFSRARLDQQFSSCFKSLGAGSGSGQEIAPSGSRYSYRVPPGFEQFTPPEFNGTPTTAVQSPATKNSNAGITIVLGEEIGIHDAAELDGFRRDLEGLLEEEAGPKGSSVSEVRAVQVPGHMAIRYTLTGDRSEKAPGVDEEVTMIFTSDGNDTVEVACRWGRTTAEKQLIHRGCETLMRSLEVD